MAYHTLRLVLGDQLNPKHSWFKQKDPDVLYVVAEMFDEANYVQHHIQKIAAFFHAMENFARALNRAGHKVLHLTLDDTGKFKDTSDLLISLVNQYQVKHFEYQQPDEYRLHKLLSELAFNSIKCVDSEHFILPFGEIPRQFNKNKAHRMEAFYRRMRKQTMYLMDESMNPTGDRWNFDAENRNAFSDEDLQHIPKPKRFNNDVSHIIKRLKKHKIKTIGTMDALAIGWPTTRKQARSQLEYFCKSLLQHFGEFQDAMTGRSPNQVFLYHSGLSFSLNTKMLSPHEVIEAAIQHLQPSRNNLSQIEGFVRQILGWREFVRGLYWANVPDYHQLNYFEHTRTLPQYFWDSNTRLNCLKHALDHSLKHAYAHHIERLMVIGNFCLLSGMHPDQVDHWYLGIYADAIEWVQLPNTRGMSQFADGGLLASKPYVSSGQYIHKMSDYCKDCHYKVKEKVGPKACPFNSLYWHFLDHNQDKLKQNPRLKFAYNNWNKQNKDSKLAVLEQASHYLKNLDSL